MRKLIIGLICGATFSTLLFTVFGGALSSTPVIGYTDSSTTSETVTTETLTDNTTFRENIYSLLQDAGNEIQDYDTWRFYQKLVQAYELDEVPETEPGEDPTVAEILPDLNKINFVALYLPLEEAGRNIQDEELAQFYYKFLQSAGWSISPDQVDGD